VNLPIRLIAAALSAAITGHAQGRLSDPNFHSWWAYAGDHRVAGNWGVHLEGQARLHGPVERTQQLFVRPAVNYHLRSNIFVTAGYVIIRNGSYGDFPAPGILFENRVYQQAIVRHRIRNLNAEHRWRMEQRWIGAPRERPGTARYQQRYRQQLRVTTPLNFAAKPSNPWYWAFSDEILIHVGSNYGSSRFDQNRAYAGIGYEFGVKGKLEFGYLNQYVYHRSGRSLENSHTLMVSWLSAMPFQRKK